MKHHSKIKYCIKAEYQNIKLISSYKFKYWKDHINASKQSIKNLQSIIMNDIQYNDKILKYFYEMPLGKVEIKNICKPESKYKFVDHVKYIMDQRNDHFYGFELEFDQYPNPTIIKKSILNM